MVEYVTNSLLAKSLSKELKPNSTELVKRRSFTAGFSATRTIFKIIVYHSHSKDGITCFITYFWRLWCINSLGLRSTDQLSLQDVGYHHQTQDSRHMTKRKTNIAYYAGHKTLRVRWLRQEKWENTLI